MLCELNVIKNSGLILNVLQNTIHKIYRVVESE